MDTLNNVLGDVSDGLYTYVLVALLVGAGAYFTVRTRGVQVRLFTRMVSVIARSRGESHGGISSFQAFAIGVSSRVGTGNIAGVAIALTLGGPGAIFWMWVVALVGMATAFVEATLAQMYKVRWRDGTFRGGPAFYIQQGLGSRGWGAVFAVLLIFVFGFAFEMVQANTIAATLESGHGVPAWVSAALLVLLTAPVVFGGIRAVARVAELLAPLMALVYVLVALAVIVLNLGALPDVVGTIVRGAFGLDEALAGTGGGLLAAVLNGARRGLFSNEAGMGSAPNAAATATVRHPAQQGLIQSLGVFVDTILVCSATAFIVLLAGPSVYTPGETTEEQGAALTQAAAAASLGDWVTLPMTVLVFVFAFSSILGNFTYAEINVDFLTRRRWAPFALRTLVTGAVLVGALAELALVWTVADIAMGLMAIVNLVAILLLGRWAVGALRDYEQFRGRELGVFLGRGNPLLPGDLPGDVWVDRDRVPTAERSS
ncbi:alanine or glycine:cation symporter, AGCS family [Georgenia satyanarayanai]|uniref:Alanine or glycine:cation symporter, AGCS family n=1 Tax=Georgenia satyanarayanai TaxID=860221 RepID=A0A2Y9APB2_9MICO|nr:alanine/glycine:cation symporter family protein [Georgenia satyanarayanai]PYF97235.1 AGCS family alanine or glycine:cation symporter [Georgenia satyanarayanai]SSA46321.1 alanine or glycine:cation symporter, AGCS family [Georgenia satyanarayanai]